MAIAGSFRLPVTLALAYLSLLLLGEDFSGLFSPQQSIESLVNSGSGPSQIWMRKSLLHRYAPSLAPTLIPIKSQLIFIFSDHWGASLSGRKGRIKLFCVETEVGPKKSP